jgi:enediyne biosynthesis protein E7
MRQVLAETMRLFPPIYVTRRTATEDVVLGGVPIPAGAMLLISPYATHRLPALWPDPERFDPERFADDRVSRTDGSYLPFLIGPKRCIGEHLAVQIMLLVFALLAEQFTLTPQAATIQVRTGATLQLGRMPTIVYRRALTSV